jgi:hypothetical protein
MVSDQKEISLGGRAGFKAIAGSVLEFLGALALFLGFVALTLAILAWGWIRDLIAVPEIRRGIAWVWYGAALGVGFAIATQTARLTFRLFTSEPDQPTEISEQPARIAATQIRKR